MLLERARRERRPMWGIVSPASGGVKRVKRRAAGLSRLVRQADAPVTSPARPSCRRRPPRPRFAAPTLICRQSAAAMRRMAHHLAHSRSTGRAATALIGRGRAWVAERIAMTHLDVAATWGEGRVYRAEGASGQGKWRGKGGFPAYGCPWRPPSPASRGFQVRRRLIATAEEIRHPRSWYNEHMAAKRRTPAPTPPPRWYRGADIPMRLIRRFAREVADASTPTRSSCSVPTPTARPTTTATWTSSSSCHAGTNSTRPCGSTWPWKLRSRLISLSAHRRGSPGA